jgi:hypothetical protein
MGMAPGLHPEINQATLESDASDGISACKAVGGSRVSRLIKFDCGRHAEEDGRGSDFAAISGGVAVIVSRVTSWLSALQTQSSGPTSSWAITTGTLILFCVLVCGTDNGKYDILNVVFEMARSAPASARPSGHSVYEHV